MTSDLNEAWLTSAQVRKSLKISTCQLAHMRLNGKLSFKKLGNAFLYSEEDCRKLAAARDLSRDTPCSIGEEGAESD